MCICDKQYHSFDRAINIKDLNIRCRIKLRKKLSQGYGATTMK